ncbi:MAG: VCBS repeat-containing protein [Armatimonadia bacterium]
MSDKGTMIELHADPTRLTTLAPLYPRTLLGPDNPAAIVGPCASEAQSLLADATGLHLPLAPDAPFADAETLSANAIALGHAGNNALLRRLHYLEFLRDSDYPREGYRLFSVHSPFGDGHNVLCVLGRSPEALTAGVSRLITHLKQLDGQWALPGKLILSDPAPDTGDPTALLDTLKTLTPAKTGWPSEFLQALDKLREAGEERWARAFIDLITPYATGQIPLSFWLMSAVDFWTDRLANGWQAVENLPFFTDAERLLVTNFVLAATQYCHDSITYQKWRITDEEHMIFNHHTFPATSLFFGTQYFRRHGYALPELDAWLLKSLKVFARAAMAGRSFDEGGAGYSWLVGNHLLRVSAAVGDHSYARSEKLRSYADLAAVIQNNSFELVPFGDCGAYHGTGTGAANLLLRAAQWHQDPGYKWLAEKHAPAIAAADVLAADVPSAPPSRHVGLFVLPLDPVIWRWAHLPTFPNYPTPATPPNVPLDQCFDKLALRAGWDADDDYLLLQGIGFGQHAHPNANAISQYQSHGRLFLVDNDYIRRMPKQHNMMMVIRDGQHGPIPITARLDGTAAFDGGAVTQTTLPDYNGCDWTRTMVWLKNDCCLVVDTLEAKQDAEYELRCYWRTLADTDLTAQGLHTDHQGEHFHVLEATASSRRLDIEPMPLNSTEYPKYNFGDARPKVLCETQKLSLKVGQQARFVNLLLPNGQTAAPRRTLRLDHSQIIVEGAGDKVTLSSDALTLAGQHIPLPTPLPLDYAQPEAARPLQSPSSSLTALWTAQLPSPATALAAGPADSLLFGCADGHFGTVSAAGALTVLGQADDQIGAALAAPLYGEAEPTLMFTAHDWTLRWHRPNGSERLNLKLPRNSHMPAWGRALAVADLDGDGRLWPLVGTAAWRVHALHPDGALRWTFDTTAHAVTALAVGDLNRDGRDEIAVGTAYFCVLGVTSEGKRLWQDEDYNDYWTAGPNFPYVQIADVDGDNNLEVLATGHDTLLHCIDHEGLKRWTYSLGDDPAGLIATPAAITAASRTGDVRQLDGHGHQIWRTTLPTPCTCLTSTGNLFVAGTESNRLHWLNQSGSVIATHTLSASPTHLISVGSLTIAATTDGRLTAFPQPGRL